MSLKQPSKLVLKRHLLVVLHLRLDVVPDSLDIRLADGKRSVTRLPIEIVK